jgi:hypothetical protein
MTFDVNTGKWAVIINDPSFSSVVKSFTDSNIIGGINVSGTGLSQMYNKVTLEFPHKDLRDEKDYVDLLIADADRYTRELDNTLNMQIDCINDPIQALRIATIELKQSRLDKIIEFRTDFTAIGLKAGDVIQVTASPYGYTNKQFRIIKMVEEDAVSGPLTLSITALEYDSTIYDTTDLVREERTKYTQIMPKQANAVVIGQDQASVAGNLLGALGGPLGAAAIAALLNKLIGSTSLSGALSGLGISSNTNTSNEILTHESVITNLTTSAGNEVAIVITPTITFTIATEGIYVVDSYWNWGRATQTNVNDERGATLEIWTGTTYGSGTMVTNGAIYTSDLGDVFDDLDIHKPIYFTAGSYHIRYKRFSQYATAVQIVTTVRGPVPNYVGYTTF